MIRSVDDVLSDPTLHYFLNRPIARRVLYYLADKPSGDTISNISKNSHLLPPSVHRVLQGLSKKGYVAKRKLHSFYVMYVITTTGHDIVLKMRNKDITNLVPFATQPDILIVRYLMKFEKSDVESAIKKWRILVEPVHNNVKESQEHDNDR